MEIEKKFRVKELPVQLEKYPKKVIEQGYLCTNPVVRIRKSNEDFILTYKSKFGLGPDVGKEARVNHEVEVPLNEEGYDHLKTKVDHNIIHKIRYEIPLECGFTAELDIFQGNLTGLIFVEVEFPDEEAAKTFIPPHWFGEDVTKDHTFSNSHLSLLDKWEESQK